jgi:hypothetical protein
MCRDLFVFVFLCLFGALKARMRLAKICVVRPILVLGYSPYQALESIFLEKNRNFRKFWDFRFNTNTFPGSGSNKHFQASKCIHRVPHIKKALESRFSEENPKFSLQYTKLPE